MSPQTPIRPTLVRVAALVAALLALTACESIRDAAGLTKKPPDEFAVVTKAPLIVPPDFNLRPPTPGAAPLNQQDPTSSAQTALFGASDPQTVAANMGGNFTLGEKMLLANAGAQNADPAVRAEINAEAANTQPADQSFTDRLLAGQLSPNTAKKADTRKSGWFDWL